MPGQALVVGPLEAVGQHRQVEPRAVGGQHGSAPRRAAGLPDHRLVLAQPRQPHREVPVDAGVVAAAGHGQRDRPAQRSEDVGLDRDRDGDPAVALRPEPADPDLAHASLAVGVAVGGDEPALGRGLAGARRSARATWRRGRRAPTPPRTAPPPRAGHRRPRPASATRRRRRRPLPGSPARSASGRSAAAAGAAGPGCRAAPSRPGAGRAVAGATAGHPLVLAGHHISSGVVSCFQ